MELFITAKTSKKTGKLYRALVATTKTGEYIVSFDTMTMLKVSGKLITEIQSLKDGDRIDIE